LRHERFRCLARTRWSRAVSCSQTLDKRRPGTSSWQNPGPSTRARIKARLPCLYASDARLCPVLRVGSMGASEQTYRLYNCRLCAVQVRICRNCDHGNVYCAGGCAQIARRESTQRAGEIYQLGRSGASNHAARQHTFRERQTQIVTHQGSLPEAATSIVAASSIQSPTEETHVDIASIPSPPQRPSPLQAGLRASHTLTYSQPMALLAHRCSFCRCALPAFARLGPLRGGP